MSVYTKQAEVEPGQVWKVRWHDGSFTEVEILYVLRRTVGYGSRSGRLSRSTRYSARNLKTGRVVEIKSAAKLRERVR